MDTLIVNLISYLRYLNSVCGLNVSVHFTQSISERLPRNAMTMLSPFNCHTNAYCVKVKSKSQDKCLANQKNIIKTCVKGTCNVCHAGVYEYVYPVCSEGETVGFAAVSGYRQGDGGGIPNRELWESALETEIPFELCDAVIPPLCVMLERLLTLCLCEKTDENNLILQFLNEYHTNVSLSELAKYLGRSRSAVSHLFKKENGISIRAYCNGLKLEDARKLLLSTDVPVTDIALDVGFNDTSYFISLFKNKFGMTPLKYRMQKRVP